MDRASVFSERALPLMNPPALPFAGKPAQVQVTGRQEQVPNSSSLLRSIICKKKHVVTEDTQDASRVPFTPPHM